MPFSIVQQIGEDFHLTVVTVEGSSGLSSWLFDDIVSYYSSIRSLLGSNVFNLGICSFARTEISLTWKMADCNEVNVEFTMPTLSRQC